MSAQTEPWTPSFSPWRHGGWYVDNLVYPSGAVGCVSRNFADRKWRIVCDPRPFDTAPTFPTRAAAAAAERELAEQQWAVVRAKEAEVGGVVCRDLDCLAPLLPAGDGRYAHPDADTTSCRSAHLVAVQRAAYWARQGAA